MLKSSEGRWRKRMHQPGSVGRVPNDRRLSIDPTTALSSSAASPQTCASKDLAKPPPREKAGWIVEPVPSPEEAGGLAEGEGATADHPLRHARTAAESRHYQRQLQQQQRQEAQSASTVATLIVVSLFTYALYRASIEALVEEINRDFFEGGVGGASVEEAFHYGAVAVAATVSVEGDGFGDAGAAFWSEADAGFPEPGASRAGLAWDRGVSLVTVSAWQSMAALGTGFLMSRFWRRGRRSEPSALSDADRTRRNRYLMVFAAAHLAGVGLEYYGYGVIGPIAAEVLRSTETALFCLLSLSFGIQRPGLASLPTLLLALGLALAATPASGEFRVGWGGLRASLAANFLLAVRAISAKTVLDDYGLDEVWTLFSTAKMTAGIQFIILLVVEVPRAASGLPPRLLPHLWGVGVAGGSDRDIGGGEAGSGWEGSGKDRVRLACLLLVNGLCLYGHVLALLGLLSRLSATMFAISSGYVHASLVFVLLLSLKGSATVPRSAGMVLATIAVAVYLYRTYTRGRISLSTGSDGEGPNADCDIVREGGGPGTESAGLLPLPYPLPQLPVLLREVSPMDSGGRKTGSNTGDGDGGDPAASSDSQRGGSRGHQPTTLFVPLLGTRHQEGCARPEWGRNDPSVGVEDEETGEREGNEVVVGEGGPLPTLLGAATNPSSQFAWRWMGLRPTGTPPSPFPSESERHVEAGTSLASPCFSSDSPLLPPPRPTSTARDGSIMIPSSRFGKEVAAIAMPVSESISAYSGSSSSSAYPNRSPPTSLGLRYQASDESSESERGSGGVGRGSGSGGGTSSGNASKVLATFGATLEVSAPCSDRQGGRAPAAASAVPDVGGRNSGRWMMPTYASSSRGVDALDSYGGGSQEMRRWRRDEADNGGQGAGFGLNRGRMSATGAEYGSRRGSGGLVSSSPTSSSSFSLNGFEVIDKEDAWN